MLTLEQVAQLLNVEARLAKAERDGTVAMSTSSPVPDDVLPKHAETWRAQRRATAMSELRSAREERTLLFKELGLDERAWKRKLQGIMAVASRP